MSNKRLLLGRGNAKMRYSVACPTRAERNVKRTSLPWGDPIVFA